MKDLSILIVSYNTVSITKDCLESLISCLNRTPKLKAEIIVVDNASEDESVAMLESFQKIVVIKNNQNLGFGKANNIGVAAAQGRYILFYNSDVMIDHVDFQKLINYLDEHEDVGALTIKVLLENGQLDKASHRGFPTVWNSFTYFSKLESLLGQLPFFSKLFGRYHLTHFDLNSIHEIDSPSGAFYLTRKEILDKVGAFDEQFFMYGEDLDLSYRIKNAGYKIIYYPHFSVIHLKGKSGMKRNDSPVAQKTRHHFFEAMKIFYNKHYAPKNSSIKNRLIHNFIDWKRKIS